MTDTPLAVPPDTALQLELTYERYIEALGVLQHAPFWRVARLIHELGTQLEPQLRAAAEQAAAQGWRAPLSPLAHPRVPESPAAAAMLDLAAPVQLTLTRGFMARLHEALGACPYSTGAPLIEELKRQVLPQLHEAEREGRCAGRTQ